MDRKTRKTLTMYEALHPKSDIYRKYLKRKHGGRGFVGIEMCVRSEENKLGLYACGKKVGIVKIEYLMEK